MLVVVVVLAAVEVVDAVLVLVSVYAEVPYSCW